MIHSVSPLLVVSLGCLLLDGLGHTQILANLSLLSQMDAFLGGLQDLHVMEWLDRCLYRSPEQHMDLGGQ